MKIVLAQQNYHIGNFEYNADKILKAIDDAKKDKAELIVFSELCVCGYPPRDFLEFYDFINSCNDVLEKIKMASDNIGVIVGAPSVNPVPEGKDLYNAGYFFYNQECIGKAFKTLLPTYDVFDEYRYFEPSQEWHTISFKGVKIALTICEDIWNLGDNPLYKICPMDQLMLEAPELMINLSASPFNYQHPEGRRAIVADNVRKYGLPMIYCNTVGSQTEIVFDGRSMVVDKDLKLIAEGKGFEEDYVVVNYLGNGLFSEMLKENFQNKHYVDSLNTSFNEDDNIEDIHDALILGIQDYFDKMNFKQAIIASSGGVDSALTIALASKALGPENVRCLLMPSQYSSDHSIEDAVQLSKNLENPYDILPIEPIVKIINEQLSDLFKGMPANVTEENIQARTRGNLVMAVSNKFGYILLNTSNKSELATGYGTLYGDMAGGLAVLGDVYKRQVYALCNYINKDGEIIPQHILTKAPSAELRPDQKDSDSLPPYEILDQILYQYIELRKGPKEIIAQGFDSDLVKRILRLVNINEYKRNQFCPIIRVSPKAFGVGRRMPIVGKYLS